MCAEGRIRTCAERSQRTEVFMKCMKCVNNMPIKFNKKYNLKTATVFLIIKTERSGYSH